MSLSAGQQWKQTEQTHRPSWAEWEEEGDGGTKERAAWKHAHLVGDTDRQRRVAVGAGTEAL